MVGRVGVAALFALAVSYGQTACELRSVFSAGRVSLARAIAPVELDEKMALRCFEQLAPRLLPSTKYLSLVVLADENDMECLRGKGNDGREVTSWEVWLKMLAEASIPRRAMAEVVWSQAGVSLRFRSAEGVVTKSAVRGQDPTLVRAGGATFEIIHMVMSGLLPGTEHRPGRPIRRLDVFLVADGPVKEDDCLRVTRALKVEFEAPWIFADFRQDPFFILSGAFPALHPLVSLPSLPSEQEFLAASETLCSADDHRSGCGTVMPKP